MSCDESRRADHFQHLYEEASAGRCAASGLGLVDCKRSICDCFEFSWLDVEDEEHQREADRIFAFCVSGLGHSFSAEEITDGYGHVLFRHGWCDDCGVGTLEFHRLNPVDIEP